MKDDTEIPADVRHRVEAEIAGFQAAVIDADVEYVGKLEDYESYAMRREDRQD